MTVTHRDLWSSRRYRGIGAWCGVPGSGKTYELARWALEQQRQGRPVWCSYGFKIPGAYEFRSVEEFVSIPEDTAVCVDEAPLWFDARAWSKMDPAVLVRLTQIRHFNIVMRYTCIDPGMVELRLRQITFDWYRCKPLFGPFNAIRPIKSPEGSPQLRDRDGWISFRRMDPEVCAAYDTHSNADTSRWVYGGNRG